MTDAEVEKAMAACLVLLLPRIGKSGHGRPRYECWALVAGTRFVPCKGAP